MITGKLTALAAAALTIACGLAAQADADDHFRRLGIGYSAGYHAPAACPAPSCHQKLSVWHGWKTACTLPNVRPLGGDCDCAPCATVVPCPPATPCGCGCGPVMPSLVPSGFGRWLVPGGGCSTCPGPVGQPSRAALMFN